MANRYRKKGGVIFRHPIWLSANPPPRKLLPENYLFSLISQLAQENASKTPFYTGPDPCYSV